MNEHDELKKMRSDAQKAVAGFVATATASCAVPIPVADAVLLIGEQVTMMGTISTIYKLSLKKKILQALVMGALGASGASLVGKTVVSSAFKLIPGLGSLAGGVISSGTAAILTLALGNAFIELCEAIKKGELTEADLEGKKGIEYFKKLYNKKQKNAEDANMYERPEGQGFGIIHKQEEIVMNGEKGLLIWDYAFINEITFYNPKTKESKSLLKGASDKRTEEEFNKYVSLYGRSTEKGRSILDDITLAGLGDLKGMEYGAVTTVMIRYKGDAIGFMEFSVNKSQKLILKEVHIKEEYREKGIYTYVVEQVADLYPLEVAKEVTDEKNHLN